MKSRRRRRLSRSHAVLKGIAILSKIAAPCRPEAHGAEVSTVHPSRKARIATVVHAVCGHFGVGISSGSTPPVSGLAPAVSGSVRPCPGRVHPCPGRVHPCPGRLHPCPGRLRPCPGRLHPCPGRCLRGCAVRSAATTFAELARDTPRPERFPHPARSVGGRGRPPNVDGPGVEAPSGFVEPTFDCCLARLRRPIARRLRNAHRS